MINSLCIGLFLNPASGQESTVRYAEAQKTLISRFSSSDEELRVDAIVQLCGILSATPDSVDFSTITALARTMRNDISPVVRALAARALGICCDSRASEPLVAALGSELELAVRKAIIYALASYPSREAALALIPLLKNKKQEIRAATAFTLSEIRDPAAAPALLELLRTRGKDEDAFARSRAAHALGFIGDRTTLNVLITALTRDLSSDVRREAAEALGRLATPEDINVLEALQKARLSSDPYLTMTVDAAIANIHSRNQ